MWRSRLFWRFFLSMLVVVILTTLVSLQIEKYISKSYSASRIANHISELSEFNNTLSDLLYNEAIDDAKQLLEDNPEKRVQFLVFDGYDNEILDRDNFSKQRFKRHFSHPLDAEFQSRGVALDTFISSIWGQNYYIQIRPRLQFIPWLSPRLAGSVLRLILLTLFSAVVCYVISRKLTDRIYSLQLATRKLAQQDFKAISLEGNFGNDELGQLSKDFQQMAEKLIHSEASKKQMLSDISHELRSPLARMQTTTEIARTRQEQQIDINPQLARIDTEIGRIDQLIGQIIHIQQLSLDNQSINKYPIDIVNLLEAIIDNANYEYQQTEKSVQLQMNEIWPRVEIMGDKSLLTSAFENVIRNAVSHTREKTTVIVALSKKVSQLSIIIEDRGHGIADEAIGAIFLPFVRLDSSRHRETGGYGLGLAITKAIIEKHGGTIVAQNKEKHTGLCMIITLPLL